MIATCQEFLDLIINNSINEARQVVSIQGNKVSNSKTEQGVSALMLASKVEPPSQAISIIDALMKAGASLNKRDNERNHILLYACEFGVNPGVFDRILYWNERKKDILKKWWRQCNSNKHGVWIQSCISGNVSLMKHVFRVATEKDGNEFLLDDSNHILKALEIVVIDQGKESLALEVLEIWKTITWSSSSLDDDSLYDLNTIPDSCEYQTDTDWDESSIRTIHLTDILKAALVGRMFDFILSYYETLLTVWSKNDFHQFLWSWMQEEMQGNKFGELEIHPSLMRFSNKYEIQELWKKMQASL